MKKALIVSIKAGYGHHSTGKAIMDYLSGKGIHCEMLDTFEYINPILGESIQDGYLLTTKYLPEAFGKVYSTLDKKETKYNKYSLVAILSNIVSHKLKEYVMDYNPDIIIGTHSYACMVMTYLHEKGYVSCPTIGIITDFTVHPFWESTDLDYYVTASELLNTQMVRKGISKDKIMPWGIPIKSKFSTKISQKSAREQLGVKDKKTILVMMGSMGFGNVADKLKSIDGMAGDFQIMCVCGNNDKMKKELDREYWKKDVYTYGFVDNVELMMDAAECIITKPGGLTSSEALAKQLPIILMNPIPGQEDRNMEFLVNNGAAVMVTDTFPLEEAVECVMNNEWRMDLLKKSVAHIGKPDSTKQLGDFVCKLVGKPLIEKD